MPVYAIVALNCSKKPFSSGLFSQVEVGKKEFRAFHLSAHRTRLLKNFYVYMWMWTAHAFYADATDLPYLILLLYNMQQKSDLCDFIDNIAIFFILFDD